MGNAYSKNSAVQQPPPVCRKPPDKIPAPTPPINELILQAFIDIEIPYTPGTFSLKALVILNPFPALNMWLGNTNFPLKNAEVEILLDPLTNLYSVEITAHYQQLPINSMLWLDVPLQTVEPWKLPFLNEQLPVASEHWQINVLT